MDKRRKSLERITEVKQLQRRAAEWRLADVRRRMALISEDQRGVITALNADEPLHGLFVDTMAKHLSVLSERLDALGRAEERQRANVERETIQAKQAERLLEGARRADERAEEWKELSEAIEAAVARRDASLP